LKLSLQNIRAFKFEASNGKQPQPNNRVGAETGFTMTTVLGDGTNRKSEERHQNNLIAQSDYEKALEGFRDYFHKEQNDDENVIMSHAAAGVEHVENASPAVLRRKTLFKACQLSLEQNFKRIVQPIPDEEFHAMMDQYYPHELEEEPTQELVEEQEEEYEEEEDLLDPKALEQAQQLREKVRQISQRVEKYRNQVLLRASATTAKSSSRNQEILTSDSRPDLAPRDENPILSTSELHTSMTNLVKLLNHPNMAEIPNKMMSLQETMAVIQRDTSPTKTLSQTESAILSRTNDKENEEVARQLDLLTPPSPGGETPQDRLARFLSKVSV
jgi:hypothetical protein